MTKELAAQRNDIQWQQHHTQALRDTAQSLQVGRATAHALSMQSEQLGRSERMLDGTQTTVDMSKRVLRGTVSPQVSTNKRSAEESSEQLGKVAIAVTSSGIAATLLTGGHTAHSTFRIPLKLSEFSTCNFSWQSPKAELIRKAILIIWDETFMPHRACFEAVDRSFRDIMKNELEPFEGKTHLQQARLAENMHIWTAPSPSSAAELAEFSDFLLQIGEGRYSTNAGISESDICLPRDMCIIRETPPCERWENEEAKEDEDMEATQNFSLLSAMEPSADPDIDDPDQSRRKRIVSALIDAVYPQVADDTLLDEYFVERVILAPANASVRYGC